MYSQLDQEQEQKLLLETQVENQQQQWQSTLDHMKKQLSQEHMQTVSLEKQIENQKDTLYVINLFEKFSQMLSIVGNFSIRARYKTKNQLAQEQKQRIFLEKDIESHQQEWQSTY